jgi:hypothetical protein
MIFNFFIYDRAIMKLKHQSSNLASLYLNMTFFIARA